MEFAFELFRTCIEAHCRRNTFAVCELSKLARSAKQCSGVSQSRQERWCSIMLPSSSSWIALFTFGHHPHLHLLPLSDLRMQSWLSIRGQLSDISRQGYILILNYQMQTRNFLIRDNGQVKLHLVSTLHSLAFRKWLTFCTPQCKLLSSHLSTASTFVRSTPFSVKPFVKATSEYAMMVGYGPSPWWGGGKTENEPARDLLVGQSSGF